MSWRESGFGLVGPEPLDYDRLVLGVAAPRLQLDPVLGRAVEALQRDPRNSQDAGSESTRQERDDHRFRNRHRVGQLRNLRRAADGPAGYGLPPLPVHRPVRQASPAALRTLRQVRARGMGDELGGAGAAPGAVADMPLVRCGAGCRRRRRVARRRLKQPQRNEAERHDGSSRAETAARRETPVHPR